MNHIVSLTDDDGFCSEPGGTETEGSTILCLRVPFSVFLLKGFLTEYKHVTGKNL